MNFEDIEPPNTPVRKTLLLCESITTKPRKKVRLFYSDGRRSPVKQVDPRVLVDARRACCFLPREKSSVYNSLLWHFVKVKDVETLEMMLGFMEEDSLITRKQASEALRVSIDEIDRMLADGLLCEGYFGGRTGVWLSDVKKLNKEGYGGGITLV